MKNKFDLLLPLLAGFFVMGFGDIIGTVMNQVKAECTANAESISWLMPIFAYVWFLVISIPTGVMAGRIGRRNAVLVSLAVTVVAMTVPLFANADRWYLYVVAFALVGIGNTIIQAALPALMVMAIVGGGIVSALLGFAQSSFGPVGIVATLGFCIAYLFVLGLFANKRAHLV